MRLYLKASLLLSSLGATTVSSLSTDGGGNVRRTKQIGGSSSRGVGPLSSTIIDTNKSAAQDVLAQLGSNRGEPGSRKRRRKSKGSTAERAPGAPLVDSSLLRFISAQKKLQRATALSETEIDSSVSDLQQTIQKSSNNKVDVQLLDEKIGGESNQEFQSTQESNTADESSSNKAQIGAEQSQSQETLLQQQEQLAALEDATAVAWLGQFNQNRIAQVLLSVDGTVDDKTAQLAGRSVQRHVLARTARRRIREFVKRRDSLLLANENNNFLNGQESDGSSNSSGTISNFEEQGQQSNQSNNAKSKPVRPPADEYGFDDVVHLMQDFGLTGRDIAVILIHTPSLAVMMPKRAAIEEMCSQNDFSAGSISNGSSDEGTGETLEETMTRAMTGLLCGTLKLRRYDARKVMRSCPGLLTLRGSKSAEQVVRMLSKLGVSTNSIARDKVSLPNLLSRSPSALFRFIAYLSSDEIRMPVKNIGPLLRKKTCADVLNAVAPVRRPVAPEDDLDDIEKAAMAGGGDADNALAIAALWGSGYTYSELRRKSINEVYTSMSATARTLRDEIGTQDLGKVIAAYPDVLMLDASTQILPTASYLMNDLGIWEDDLPRVLQLYPKLLGRDVDEMKDIVNFMLNTCDVQQDNLSSIFRSFPALLTMDKEKDMVPIISFLREIGIVNIGRFVTRLPPVLGYNLKRDIVPKYEFLKTLYPYETFELSKFPAYLSYPLDRIKARFAYLKDVKGLPIQLIALDLVVRFGDRDFATRVAGDKDNGIAYATFLEEQRRKSGAPRKGSKKKKVSKKLQQKHRRKNNNQRTR